MAASRPDKRLAAYRPPGRQLWQKKKTKGPQIGTSDHTTTIQIERLYPGGEDDEKQNKAAPLLAGPNICACASGFETAALRFPLGQPAYTIPPTHTLVERVTCPCMEAAKHTALSHCALDSRGRPCLLLLDTHDDPLSATLQVHLFARCCRHC